MDEYRQLYLANLEGGDLTPAESAFVDAYVNGVEGQSLDKVALCRMIGSRVKTDKSAADTLRRIFKDKGSTNATHLAMREYARWLRARNLEKTDKGAAWWRHQMYECILMAKGELAQQKVFSASAEGRISVKQVEVEETSLPALHSALKTFGEHIGVLKGEADSMKPHEDWVADMQKDEGEL